jgi:uncharacterized membrane protein YfcA
MDSVFIVVIIGAALAGFVQGLSGFAFGLVSMSVWAWTIDPQMAAAMSVFGALTGQLLAAVTVRRRLNIQMLAPFLAGGLLGIPLGVVILPHLDTHLFKAVLGAILIVFCPLMLLSKRFPHVTFGGRIADGFAGVIGGLMGGLGGFAGTVPTLWCTLRGLEKDTQRAIVQNFNLGTLAVTMAVYVGTGLVTREMVPMFAVVAPAMLIPTLLGARLYIGISEQTFRKIVLGLLIVSGFALLSSSIPTLLSRV